MIEKLAYVLVVLGCVVAATAGARNSPELVAARQEIGKRLMEAEKTGVAAIPVPLPLPSTRLSSWAGDNAIPWVIGVLLVGAGGFIARREQKNAESGKGGSQTEGRIDFLASLATIRDGVVWCNDAVAGDWNRDVPEVRARIDGIFREVIDPLVAQRGRFLARHGMTAFAVYFGEFSGGERQLARAWSALTDGRADVAAIALTESAARFQAAEEAFRKAEGS